MAKLLLGDDEDSGGVERFWEADVDARDAWGNTPFDRCVRFDDPDMARFFLERSKNILAGDGHAKKRVTTGCALAMKIAELEERQHSTHEDDKVFVPRSSSEIFFPLSRIGRTPPRSSPTWRVTGKTSIPWTRRPACTPSSWTFSASLGTRARRCDTEDLKT